MYAVQSPERLPLEATNLLVANAIDHAHTMMTLRLSLQRRYLNIAVRDGSPRPPVPCPRV